MHAAEMLSEEVLSVELASSSDSTITTGVDD